MIYSDPACDPSRLASLYHDATVNYDQQQDEIYDSYAAVLDRALPLVGSRGTFLEIGGGTGFHAPLRGRARIHAADRDRAFCAMLSSKFKPASDRTRSSSAASSRRARCRLTRSASPAFSRCSRSMYRIRRRASRSPMHDALELAAVWHPASPRQHLGARSAKPPRRTQSDLRHRAHLPLQSRAIWASLFCARRGFEQVDSRVANRYALRHWFHLAPVPGKDLISPILEKTGLASLPIRLNAGNFGVVGVKPGGPARGHT